MNCLDCQLSSVQRKQADALVKAAGDALVSATVLPNVDFSNEAAFQGMVLVFKADAPVDATFISDNLFQQFLVANVLEGPFERTMDDAHFVGRSGHISTAIERETDAPASMSINNDLGREIKEWKADIGPNGFAGIYSQLKDNHKDKDYFVVAQGNATKMVQELKEEIIASGNDLTWRELVTPGTTWHKKMANVAHVSSRLVRRNMATLADAAQVRIMQTRDSSSHLPMDDGNSRDYPWLAIPQHSQDTHAIQLNEDRKTVSVYYGVQPSVKRNSNHYIVADKDKSQIIASSSGGGSKVPCTGSFNKAYMKRVGWNAETHTSKLIEVVSKK